MSPVTVYPLRDYIAAQLYLPEYQRGAGEGTQRAFARHFGQHSMTVSRWVRKGYLIDETGQLYGPKMKLEGIWTS